MVINYPSFLLPPLPSKSATTCATTQQNVSVSSCDRGHPKIFYLAQGGPGCSRLLQAPAQPQESREVSATKSCSHQVKKKNHQKPHASADLKLNEFPFNQQGLKFSMGRGSASDLLPSLLCLPHPGMLAVPKDSCQEEPSLCFSCVFPHPSSFPQPCQLRLGAGQCRVLSGCLRAAGTARGVVLGGTPGLPLSCPPWEAGQGCISAGMVPLDDKSFPLSPTPARAWRAAVGKAFGLRGGVGGPI